MENQEILKRIQDLAKKYSSTGQDLKSYLDGLLYSDYVGYWNYIHLETLLSLQNPKTDFPDEQIFILYHQITELYFKLILIELEQINYNGKQVLDTGQDLGWHLELNVDLFIEKLKRINRYFSHLINSFDIMILGMEKDQFLKFRMALLPSSGFQSVQYRMIEIHSSDLINLTQLESKQQNKKCSIEELFPLLYWKVGAKDLKTQQKTYTLTQFERKYESQLIDLSKNMQTRNIWQKYKALSIEHQSNKELIKLLKEFDTNININWCLSHYKSAIKYLKNKNSHIQATGGTNWQDYLPPKFQKIIFFPELWTDEEKNNWGKSWVDSISI
jgi:tryptophan 2,3-dioxygenase